VIDWVPFGADQHGAPVRLWRLHNSAGAMACVSELGATLVRLDAPDRRGEFADVTLGFDCAEDYLLDPNYLGCIVGRYAGRIAGGRFIVDGRVHQAPCNEGSNLLHGGVSGFHRKLWRASSEGDVLRLDLTSADGEAGFPGEVTVCARYAFSDDFALTLRLEATTTASTPFNLTHHAYWNLAGADAASVLDHDLSIAAGRYVTVATDMSPTGVEPVHDTPFDFRAAKPIGRDLDANHPQLALAGGYDHAFLLDGVGLRPVATLGHPPTGRRLIIQSDLPWLRFYSFNWAGNVIQGKDGATYRARSAVALEPQGLPGASADQPMQTDILRPGDAYSAIIRYVFDGGG
jgi:aldose 1-epimerase